MAVSLSQSQLCEFGGQQGCQETVLKLAGLTWHSAATLCNMKNCLLLSMVQSPAVKRPSRCDQMVCAKDWEPKYSIWLTVESWLYMGSQAPADAIQQNQVAAAVAGGKPLRCRQAERGQALRDQPCARLLPNGRRRRATRHHLAQVPRLASTLRVWITAIQRSVQTSSQPLM